MDKFDNRLPKPARPRRSREPKQQVSSVRLTLEAPDDESLLKVLAAIAPAIPRPAQCNGLLLNGYHLPPPDID
jgi:hypothetical protein